MNYRYSNDFKTQQFKPQDLITSTDLRLSKSKVFTPSSQNFARTSRTSRQDSKALNDLGGSNLSQKDELEQLSQQEQQARMQLEISEQKLSKLSNQLDAEYQLKIQEIDRVLKVKQDQYKEFVETTKQYQIQDMIEELKNKVNEQKQQYIQIIGEPLLIDQKQRKKHSKRRNNNCFNLSRRRKSFRLRFKKRIFLSKNLRNLLISNNIKRK